MKKSDAKQGIVRAGIGGWVYPPWRGVFYPKGLKQADELEFAAKHLTTIEINATHYRLQSPASFRKWADTAPQSFVFSVKGPRLVTQQKALAETGKFIERFIGSGLSELGDKLGPILWQFAPFKRFDEEDFAKFLALLPNELDGLKLNHVVEARHRSFENARFVDLLRDHNVTAAYTDAESWPNIADLSGDVVYARLQQGDDKLDAAYPSSELDAWGARAKSWAQGEAPKDLPLLAPALESKPSDVFVYFIHEGKLKAPAAAMALIERL
jgi:uncharacterized protein YecE (DUF72 family)